MLEALVAITTDGWPPTITTGGTPAPRWPYEQDRFDQAQWIVARTNNLWVVVRPDFDSFDFITAINPARTNRNMSPGWSIPNQTTNQPAATVRG